MENWLINGDDNNPYRLTQGNRVELLIDNENSNRRIRTAIENARDHVHICQVYWEPDLAATWSGSPRRPEITFRDLCVQAANRGVKVRVVINASPVIDFFAGSRAPSAADVEAMFKDTGVEVHPLHILNNNIHTKFVLIDGQQGFIIGSPWMQSYMDTERHDLLDPRRGDYATHHDVSLLIMGPAVQHLEFTFRELWNSAVMRVPFTTRGYSHRIDAPPAAAPQGNQSLQIVRTFPRAEFAIPADGEQTILQSYVQAIRNARRLIYVENQYFTSKEITAALKGALAENPCLELIMVINHEVDMPSYPAWQNELITELGYFNDHPRVGVFSAWGIQARGSRPTLEMMYVHTKAAIIDDRWASIGTANLDHISLGGQNEYIVLEQNVETNAILVDGIAGQPETGEVASLRRGLWSHFLGISPDSLRKPPTGQSWLQIWREHAEGNRNTLNAAVPSMRGHILRYTGFRNPKSVLGDLGIEAGRFNVMQRGI